MLCFGANPRIGPMSVDQNGAKRTSLGQPRSKSGSNVRVTDTFFVVGPDPLLPTTCTSIDTVDSQIQSSISANIHT